MEPREQRAMAVENAVTLRIRMDIPQLKRDLLTPYAKPKFANEVFIRALGAINLLERDIQELLARPTPPEGK